MKRIVYRKPTTVIVKLQHTGMLMGSDDRLSKPSNYRNGGDPFWDE